MSATLLLADDSITIQRVIELTFADESIRVVVAGDGQQAIQRIDAERPDIVLADVGMPKIDGYGVAAHVKQSPALRHIPVILLTGAFEPIDEAKARATGCDGILVKPLQPELLIARVKELLAGRRTDELWPAELPRVESPAASAPSRAPAPPTAPAPPAVAPVPVPVPAVVVPLPMPVEAPAPTPDMLRPANRNPPPRASHRTQQAPRDLPPPVDVFESELDMLDVALSRLEPTASPNVMDAATASEFARDLEALRNEQTDEDAADAAADGNTDASPGRPVFGDWDLPAGRVPKSDHEGGRSLAAPIDIVAEELPAAAAIRAPEPVRVSAPEPAVIIPPPAEPAPVVAAPPEPAPVPPGTMAASAPAVEPAAQPAGAAAPPPLAARPSLANAFSALLAAERSQPAARTLTASATLSEGAIEDVVKRVLARMTDEAVHKVVLDAAERIIREEIERLKSPSPPPGH